MRRVWSVLLLLTLMGGVALTSNVALAQDLEKSLGDSDEAGEVDHAVSAGFFAGALVLSDRHEFYDPMKDYAKLDTFSVDLGLRLSYLPIAYVGLEAEGIVALPSVDGGSLSTMYAARAQVIGQYPIGKFTPFAVAGFGLMGISSDSDELGSDKDGVAHVGTGAKFEIVPHWVARADLRLLVAPKGNALDEVTAHGEILLGLAYDFGSRKSKRPSDPDRDGFIGDADQCPNEFGPEPVGCPAKDEDGDGLIGDADACPLKAETVNGFEDEDGCPDERPDTDKDGVLDYADGCPSAPEDMDNFEDEDGCPDADNDADGVYDVTDNCPIEAGPAENKGCPDTDRDEDTVVDRLDNCPDEKGSVEEHGCKKKQLVVITSGKLDILEKVYFQTNKAIIRKRSFAVLNNVAEVLKSHPDIKNIQVAGHTDDRGTDESNLDLSQRRAEAVARYLVEQGVDFQRLTPKGFGETTPAVEGTSRSARDSNRRVEFKIITN